MSDEEQRHKCREAQSRANQASELINNPLYVEAITAMKAAMYSAFTDTKLEDELQRHELWQRMQLMKQFEGKFESILKEGKRAAQTLSFLNDKTGLGIAEQPE
jgi:hypothetical protein